jgi:enoyl-CoA hydratase
VKAAIGAAPDRIEKILEEASVAPPPARIAGNMDRINRSFASDRLEEILAALEAEGSDWTRKSSKH